MTWRRGAAIFALVFYAFLWVLATHGVTSLVAPLVIPVVLAILVWSGLALNKYLGIRPRSQHFQERDDEDEA